MAKARFALGGAAVLLFLGTSSAALADCYVDSQSGNDSNDGQSDASPWQSQTAVASSCTVIRYKRGSIFNEALRTGNSASGKTFANYGNTSDPLPRFVMPTGNSGSIVSSFQGGLTIDGLYLAGSHGDGSGSGMGGGVCVMLGSSSKLLNSEIADCDIGIMLSGTGSLIQGNYIHDLAMAVDAAADSGVDPNAVGGAEGIFINGSNNEVSYNSFVNCSATAAWTGGSCDGGATEVAVGAGATVSGVKVHHNFSYNNCGFFEVSSMAGSSKGTFADSEFYDNVYIDSGWLMLLQVNNTNLSNIQWNNNTVVQHSGSTNAGMLTTIFTGTSSGTSGGELAVGAVSLTNNLIIFDGVRVFGAAIHENITQTTNLVVDTASQDPGVVNVKGTTAEDYDLTSSSPAVNAGTTWRVSRRTIWIAPCRTRAVQPTSARSSTGLRAVEPGVAPTGEERARSAATRRRRVAGTPPAVPPGNRATKPAAVVLAGGSSGAGRGLVGLLCLGATLLFWRRRPGKVVR